MGEEDSFALGRQSARAEALGLYRMVGHGRNTVESLRELIAVPPKIERVLLAFAQVHPEEAHSIERNLKFRLSVAREFERLVREGIPVADLPEVEESEFDAAEETFAVAYHTSTFSRAQAAASSGTQAKRSMVPRLLH